MLATVGRLLESHPRLVGFAFAATASLASVGTTLAGNASLVTGP